MIIDFCRYNPNSIENKRFKEENKKLISSESRQFTCKSKFFIEITNVYEVTYDDKSFTQKEIILKML